MKEDKTFGKQCCGVNESEFGGVSDLILGPRHTLSRHLLFLWFLLPGSSWCWSLLLVRFWYHCQLSGILAFLSLFLLPWRPHVCPLYFLYELATTQAIHVWAQAQAFGRAVSISLGGTQGQCWISGCSNQRLREDMARPRIRVSEASAKCVRSFTQIMGVHWLGLSSLIRHCKTTKDHLVRWIRPLSRSFKPVAHFLTLIYLLRRISSCVYWLCVS